MKYIEQQTVTEVATQTKEDNSWIKGINKVMFILFAEFMGYVSPILDWAEDIANGKSVEGFKVNALKIEAEVIYKLMSEKMSQKEMKDWWDLFYPYMKQYETTVKYLDTDLPF